MIDLTEDNRINIELLCSWFAWTEDQYWDFVTDAGCKYVDHTILADGILAEASSQEQYWDTFHDQWMQRDTVFVSAIMQHMLGLRPTCKEVDAPTIRLAYQKVNSLHALLKNTNLDRAFKSALHMNIKRLP